MHPIVLLLSFLLMPVFAVANEGEKSETGLQYIEIGPNLIVNLANSKQIMKISPQLMVEGAEAAEHIKKNMPALKNALIMLYSGRKSEELATAEQREALRKETAEVIEKTLDRYATSDGFKDVFFTDFRIN